MRWIITTDHMGGCLGLGEDADGIPTRGTPEQGDTLPMAFQLLDARGALCFEGRCGDIDDDWWHGFEPLMFAWTTHARCRRLRYRRADSEDGWRDLRPRSGAAPVAAGADETAPVRRHAERGAAARKNLPIRLRGSATRLRAPPVPHNSRRAQLRRSTALHRNYRD